MKSTKDSKKIILTTKKLYYMLLTYKIKMDFFPLHHRTVQILNSIPSQFDTVIAINKFLTHSHQFCPFPRRLLQRST